MEAFKYNINIDEGTTFDETVTWLGSDSTTPVNLTGCIAKLQIREKIKSPAVLLELTTINGGIVLGGLLGTINIKILPVVTAAITWKSGVYDMLVTFPDGSVKKKMYGSATVNQTVTQ
jgi:hypothetical protein